MACLRHLRPCCSSDERNVDNCKCLLGITRATALTASSSSTDSGVTITENITDTENLLGSHAAEVTDAIAKTEKETGVHVHLLYLSRLIVNRNRETGGNRDGVHESKRTQ